MSNDFQNAYDLSRMEYRSNSQRRELEALILEGKYVIAGDIDIHCKFTDAVIACETHILSIHSTREEAETAFEDDGVAYIVDPSEVDPDPEIAYGPISEEEQPF